MKSYIRNHTLTVAIAVSVVAHAALLAVRFVAPDAFKFKPKEAGLEIILVNAKHDKAPLKADAIAQANLDGGGNADAGRAKSPLPDLRRVEDGDAARSAKRKVEQMEQAQRNLMAQLEKKSKFTAPPITNTEKQKDVPLEPDGTDIMANAKALIRREAEIARSIEEYNKKPRKTFITPSTRKAEHAQYYKEFQDKVEKVGTLNFPQQSGKRLYGELTVSIPLNADGTIYTREGGLQIDRSSGIPALDKAALDIVRRAAPFGRFPANMLSEGTDVWEITTRFIFTREDALQTETRSR